MLCKLTSRIQSKNLISLVSIFGFKSSAMSSDDGSTEKPSRAEQVKKQKEKYASMSIDEKRKLYKTSRVYTLEDVPTWNDFAKIKYLKADEPVCPKNDAFNAKLSLWAGDITHLEIDAIVNAANSSLMGGGGVDGAIHRAAGPNLKNECYLLNGCDTGDAKLTSGYDLPAKFVIHTVGPMGEKPPLLASCYVRCLTLCRENSIRSVAFPCISTGIYGYPNKGAVEVVLKTVREWLETEGNADRLDRIIFCVFLDIDKQLYADYMPKYFPVL